MTGDVQCTINIPGRPGPGFPVLDRLADWTDLAGHVPLPLPQYDGNTTTTPLTLLQREHPSNRLKCHGLVALYGWGLSVSPPLACPRGCLTDHWQLRVIDASTAPRVAHVVDAVRAGAPRAARDVLRRQASMRSRAPSR